MGRTTLIKKFEITPEFKEIQILSEKVHFRGDLISLDPINETITFANGEIMNYENGKIKLEKMIEDGNNSTGSNEFKDPEEELKKERALAKRLKKQRVPGAPPELKALIRRSKRIYKKAIIKGLSSPDASLKASKYLERKSTPEDLPIAAQHLLNYIAKELS